MLDAASSDLAAAAGSSTSIPPLATDLAAVTLAAALLEANTRPPSSVGVDVTATAVTTAANVANNAHGWMLYSTSKVSSIAADKRPLFFQVCGCADYRWMCCKKYGSAKISRGEEKTKGIGLLLARVF